MKQDQLRPISGPGPNVSKPIAAADPFQPANLRQAKAVAALTALLIVCFSFPLFNLARFAIHSELFSHILLIPLISLYLVWLQKNSLPKASAPDRRLALVPFVASALVLAGYWLASHSGVASARSDHLTWITLAFVFAFWGVCFVTLGNDTLRALAFPIGFLIFLVPFPSFLVNWIETFLQYSSAEAADLLFTATGMSFFRDGLAFQLPGIRLHVAPECSGIHSTLVLFVTSLVACQLFLASPWKRALLVAAVIPLGILRNAVRIVTIGQLCVHVGPEMIDSPIHHRGGPLFFAVSLVPLFLLLYYLRRSEPKTRSQANLNQPS